MKLLVKNIGQLVQARQQAPKKVSGKDMADLPVLENAFLLMEGGSIADFGGMDGCPDLSAVDEVLDASGKPVFPCWCDSHTHIVYAGSREGEFVDKIKGLSYVEIARRGGGILNSAARLAQAPEAELYGSAFARLEEMMGFGTGAVEIKSGYGLSVQAELKMLRVIKRLKESSPLQIKATFLGAHAVPAAYKGRQPDYVSHVINDMLPPIAEEGLADYIDVFCDQGFFTPEETARILEAGEKFGLRAKIHANELANSGGIQVGVRHNALSVDHLEHVGEAETECLLNSGTMPTLLPSTAFFLDFEYAPARKMIDAGLPVALATDYNPGSSPSGNMPFVLSLACTKMKMLPSEAINASTVNGAYAMNLDGRAGCIAKGALANVFIAKPMPSPDFLPYAFGSNLVETVILNGKVAMRR